MGLNCVWLYILFIFNNGLSYISTHEISICSTGMQRVDLELDTSITIAHTGELEFLSNEISNNASLPVLPSSKCWVKIVTCGSCHLTISVLYLKMKTCSTNSSCSCDYLNIKEPDYDYEKPNTRNHICGFLTNTSNVFVSQTKMVTVEYVSSNFKSAFALQIKSVENVYKIIGQSSDFNLNNTGFIESPYFPMEYPSDYSCEFFLENANPNGLVQLTFTDFKLEPWSFVEIYDINDTRLRKFNGNVFRPPTVLSTGPYLSLKFNANEESRSRGFRAQYHFKDYQEKRNVPNTDCGRLVQDQGGTLTMSFMPLNELIEEKSYDCIWIIQPLLGQLQTHLSLRVVHFDDFAPGSVLKIYEGVTSKDFLLETLSDVERNKRAVHSREYILSASRGFYIRSIGEFTNFSKLAIVYATFKYGGCSPVKEFQCSNNRCIRSSLHCDGYNHCGDGSDEISCSGGTMSPQDPTWWRTLTPNSNYYFPKQESSGYGETNTLILITSLTGLGMFILTTALILVKLHKQRREDAVNREVLSTISADVDSSPNRSPYITTLDPPVYDPPPSYDDVIKFYLPPPPTYTSVITPNPRNGRSSGVENSAFVPDSETTIHPASNTSQRRFLPPKLLTVILPARRLLGFDTEGPTSSTGPPIEQRVAATDESSLSEKEPKQQSPEPQLVDLGSLMPDSVQETVVSIESTFSSETCNKCICKGACSCPRLSEDEKL